MFMQLEPGACPRCSGYVPSIAACDDLLAAIESYGSNPMAVTMASSHDTTAPASGRALLSVVVPVYNETAVLREFHRRLCGVLAPLPVDAEIVYVNDGSTDASLVLMQSLKEAD